MWKAKHISCICILAFLFGACVKSFQPKLAEGAGNYLVVEGRILAGSPSKFNLSRARPVGDTIPSPAEKNAEVFIESFGGQVFPCVPDSTGVYISSTSIVDPSQKYRLKIITENGRMYQSDYVNVKTTPAIDSLYWEQDENTDVHIYLATHDPLGSTRYYLWDFAETYEYHSAYQSYADFRDGMLVFLDPEEYVSTCYTTLNSKEILVGSSAVLSDDVIRKQHIIAIANDNSKISVRYSILVNQYAISAEEYNYWRLVKQNSEPGGEIFDPQPSQLFGNIHSTTDPEEPVIGYISASSVSQKRLFITWGELKKRTIIDNSVTCKETLINVEDAAKFLSDGTRKPAYFVGNGTVVAIAPVVCVDCRVRGGILEKPSFW